ncbi:hypothetical protein OVY48_09840 [Sphingobium sp. SA2]|uniref:hypothetical protein n=1 Tax=Sphingobium sp. SA2 TaxID=1524832 RepID=UPI0028C14C45|nr:hypothetical protein [Sphingobium sp. SA2]MDT7533724.1 hypothetical protein [Sphingobium sp. SA2]
MGNILITPPAAISALTVSRGSGADNLLTPDPREAWVDSTVGTPVTIDIDLGIARVIDTVFLGSLFNAHPDATWAISGGLAGYGDVSILAIGVLRVPERGDWRRRTMSHALWFGAKHLVRYLRIAITQPGDATPLSIGALIVGEGFQPRLNKEWGAERGVRDSSSVTRLPGGGVSVVEGARYATYGWTLGDLSTVEADVLFELVLDRGESRPVVVVEDPATSIGLRNRIHYGALTGLRSFTRRNVAQTSWQLVCEDWAIEPDPILQSDIPSILGA